MNKKLLKPILAVIICAAAIAGMIALPALMSGINDARLYSGAQTLAVSPRADTLSVEGAKNPAALALYIERAYIAGEGAYPYEQLTSETELEALKATGVVPQSCVLVTNYNYTQTANGAQGFIEPVSGLVKSVVWTGDEAYYEYTAQYRNNNKLDSRRLIADYTAYLGLGDIDDWVPIEFKGAYQEETTLGRWSPSCEVYISTTSDADGKSGGITASSHSAAEMEPLLGLGEAGSTAPNECCA